MSAPLDWKVAPEALKRAHERLNCLYEISKRLTRFETIDQTVPEVLALISKSLPVATAILILEEQRASKRWRTRAIEWHTGEVSPSRLQAAKAHATATYGYLARRPPRIEAEAGTGRIPSTFPPPTDPVEGKYLLLPLVVPQGAIFGALQIESDARLDETDLKFVNGMVGQLSIALDRIALIESKEAADKAALLAAEFLAEASVILFSSLDYQMTIAMAVRAAVPPLADLCFIDELRMDGTIDRVAVAVADSIKQELADRLRNFAPATDAETPAAEVFRTGRSVLSGAVPPFYEIVRLEGFEALGAPAIMSVPLTARGRTLGVLTFLSVQPGHRYSEKDLALAEEVGRRAAIAIDNARLYEQAQRATQAREELLAAVSHDLRNPLGSITMSASFLQKTPLGDVQGPEVTKSVETILRSAERMSRLIGDLLDVASIEAGHLTLDTASHPVVALVEEAVEAHQPAASAKGMGIKTELLAASDAVDCDRERILEVLDNLLSNAIKFTSDGGSITVGAERLGDFVLFSVADTGSGIRTDELSHVFDRFWQAKKTARLGTGLGLPIAKGLVEANGGKLWVESKFGAGSTFFFTVPRSLEIVPSSPDLAVAPPHAGASRFSTAPRAGRTILVVDDYGDLRLALGQVFKRLGYQVAYAGNGAEALAYLRAVEPPFLIVLDLLMPVMDGRAFLREREREPALKGIPVIVVSAEVGLEKQSVEENVAYFQKPIAIDRLLHAIEDLSH